MNLKQLKKWINNIPESELDNDDYILVFRKITELDHENW